MLPLPPPSGIEGKGGKGTDVGMIGEEPEPVPDG